MNKSKIKHLIAGPCSAETEKQVLNTAKAVSGIKEVSLFRAGIWKPRTSPNSFNGVGDIGLKWLTRIKDEYGFKVITEVATPLQAEKCLEHNIDAVWIGTRTTINPFYVQEIASSLQGTNIPVYIKNPIIPDLSLWGGAIERFKNAGIKDIVAIHRGFYTYGESRYRNEPIWDIPSKLKEEYPEIDLICDPSHIAGDKNLVGEVFKMATLHDMQGFMIETHLNPTTALSDKDQQITPYELTELLSSLKTLNYNEFTNTLKIRDEFNKLETDILNMLTKRFQLVKELMEINGEKSITLYKLEEWKEWLKELKNDSKELNLNQSFINQIVNIIIRNT